MKNEAFVILGPTCSGKTSLALDLCKRCNGEIISADSRQVVKYMDIGTGKLPIDSKCIVKKGDEVWTIDDIPIWGYDLTTPEQYFTGVDWVRGALERTKFLVEKGKKVFIVGGTGFYIDLFTGDKKPAAVKPDYELRKSLETTPTKNLLTWLMSLNPSSVDKLDTKNRVRIIRALEIELGKETRSSTPLPSLKNFSVKKVGLKSSRRLLYQHADQFVEEIWAKGLVKEIQKLLGMGYKDTTKMNGLIYKTGVQYVNGEVGEKDAIERIKFDMHAYIRRQQTYFKKMSNVDWYDIARDGFKEKIYTLASG
ncbi:tRNA (adenosine(37)-N6)-dimethylallyltransferase MiaA [Patescibacteria group bacterium]|nr:tRNA (adenosine(37)-N6)-dimethylallyltransferase MiaA [Patescibacteria group bacterium]